MSTTTAQWFEHIGNVSVVTLEHLLTMHLRVPPQHTNLVGVAQVADGCQFCCELTNLLVANRTRSVDSHNQLTHSLRVHRWDIHIISEIRLAHLAPSVFILTTHGRLNELTQHFSPVNLWLKQLSDDTRDCCSHTPC